MTSTIKKIIEIINEIHHAVCVKRLHEIPPFHKCGCGAIAYYVGMDHKGDPEYRCETSWCRRNNP